MRKIILLVLSTFCINAISQKEIYQYPETINIDDYRISVNSLQIEAFRGYLKTISDINYYKIEAFDFNKDGKNEYFAYYSDGSSFLPFFIYREYENEYIALGEFEVYTSVFAELKNEMPQIIRIDFEGHKTNPIYYPKVFSLGNNKYELLNDPHIRIGEYRDLGLTFYKKKQYNEALVCYSNVLKPIWGMAKINSVDYNNLALVHVKLNNLKEAKIILEENINYGNKDAITYYNLAKIEEALNNKSKAIDYYEKSNELHPMKVKTEKIDELNNNR